MFKIKMKISLVCLSMLFCCCQCSKKSVENSSDPVPTSQGVNVEWWLTKGDRSVLLQKQSNISFASTTNSNQSIEVDSSIAFQSVDGFGYTLTGASAFLINHMDATSKASLLTELFGNTANSIGISYLRLSIGASDLSSNVFSYNDMPPGQTDVTLANFSLSDDTTDLVPVLQQILAINPNIKILGSPWSPPTWMKDNGSTIGGSLLTNYYAAYAKYFVKYIQAMQAKGIRIDAITIQNEPENPANNPSMSMTASEQANFIKNNLGPEFQTAGLNTKIILFDHNCDNPNYPIAILNDAAAKPFVDGSAFHLYVGDISALSNVRTAHPEKNIYFTEQWTSASGSFDGDLKWHLKNVIIGSMKNWSRIALEWNLANDPTYSQHTAGGCTECKGALTINGSAVSRNVGYYIIAHASKFVPAGSVRINSSLVSNMPNVAFKTAAGKKVLIVLNDGSEAVSFNIKYKGQTVVSNLAAGAVGTYQW